jgi:type II secretory pathway pseudopilin PulG
MQRKNNILKRAKNGMAMIMAIAVIVIIATIMALSIGLTSQTTKRTTDVYLYEQSVLLAHSAAEYALLRISQDNNMTNPCNVSSLNFTPDLDGDGNADLYDINISILYSYKNPPASCNGKTFALVTTDEQNGSILLNVTVSVNDTTVASEPIRYFKRTLQKL